MKRVTNRSKLGLLARLRELVPTCPLTHPEARVVAEAQAEQLRELLGVSTPRLPDEALTALPGVCFASALDLPTSAATHLRNGRWHVVVNARESYQRQRFSVAHELFHIIAHPRLHSLTPTAPGRNPHREGERLADYFAGSLLMPREHLVWLWSSGVQQIPELARAFCASERAVAVRLLQVGLHSAPALQLRRRVGASGLETAV